MNANSDFAPTGGTRTLGVVVPLFNEAEGIVAFHRVLVGVLVQLEGRYDWSITYVVDPSSDATTLRIRELAEEDSRVTGLFLLRRAGHQMSLIAGMERTKTDVMITLDGDLQHPPELIPEMLSLYEGGVDVVQTVRVRTEGQGFLSRVMSASFYRLMGRLSDVPMIEGGADFRLLSARVVDIVCNQVVENDKFLRGLIPWIGLPTATVEFTAPARVSGSSKYSFGRSYSLAASGLVSFSKVPLHLGVALGAVVSALAILGGFMAVLLRMTGAPIPAGWTTLVVMTAMLSGAQLFAIGLIGLYLGVVFDEAKRRPRILVAETVSRPPDGRTHRLTDLDVETGPG